MSDDHLLFEKREGIAFVTLNRPAVRNAMTLEMYHRLKEIAEEVSEDTEVKALVIMGSGEKAFTSGSEISNLQQLKTVDDALAYEQHIEATISALEHCVKPTIAAVVGACTGGAIAIAGVCDIRIAASNARFGLPMAKSLGNCMSVLANARLAELIGYARVIELVFTARLVSADEARSMGLVTEVVPAESLRDRAEEVAKLLASHAPLTLKATKIGILRLKEAQRQVEGKDLTALCFGSEDFRRGVEAFLTGQPVEWTGR